MTVASTDARETPFPGPLQPGAARALGQGTTAAAVGAATAVTVAWLCRLRLAGDAYWDLAAGRWMWAHRAVLKTNPLSWVAPHAQWINTEWLWGVILWGAAHFGPLGLIALGIVGALAFYLALAALARRLDLGPVATVVLLWWSVWVSLPGWKFRPQAWGYPAAAWAFVLIQGLATEAGAPARVWFARQRWRLGGLVVLVWFWSQFHGSWILAPLWLLWEAAWRREGRWALVALASVAAAALGPFGYAGVVHAFAVAGSPEIARTIAEWASPTLHNPAEAVTLVLYVFGGQLWLARHGSWRRWAYWAGFAAAYLWAVRFGPYLALGAAMALAGAREGIWGLSLSRTFRGTVATAGAAALVLGALSFRGGNLATGPFVSRQRNPVAAVTFLLRHHLTRRVFNAYGWGGYLAYRGIPDWIDGRADFWLGVNHDFQAYAEVLDGQRSASSLVTHAGAAVALVPPASVFAIELESAGWRPIWHDRVAVVLLPPPKGGQ
ncbi:MAG: hypothetical protein K6U14_09485 [Firmicutes bacterium]|nr:hypothetical protein [Alicyclobacillaceae bacterium]MCL6497844.1 hypothetical protein [Bacillota bacterium]